MSYGFERVEESPKDPIFGLATEFKADTREKKTNLLVGLYKKQGKPYLLPSVRQASEISIQKTSHREYLPIGGDREFCEQVSNLVFEENIPGIQTLGGTGALFAAALLLKDLGVDKLLLPTPTWPNHLRIFSDAGISLEKCPMRDVRGVLSYDQLFSVLKNKRDQWVLLDACCHNPTGVDMSVSQWEELAQICFDRGHRVIFDMAYLGFGKGIAEDALSVRLFHAKGVESLLCFSCSKNFTLYSERIGGLFPLGVRSEEIQNRLLARLCHYVRAVYSSPPSFGAAVVKEVLQSASLKKQWSDELEQARGDLQEKRSMLVSALLDSGLEGLRGIAQRVEKQKGLFAYLDIEDHLVDSFREKDGVYLVKGGRLNLSALTRENTLHLVAVLAKTVIQ